MQHEDFSIAVFGKQSLLCLPNKDKVTSLSMKINFFTDMYLFIFLTKKEYFVHKIVNRDKKWVYCDNLVDDKQWLYPDQPPFFTLRRAIYVIKGNAVFLVGS